MHTMDIIVSIFQYAHVNNMFMQAPSTVFDQANEYYIYYGRNSSSTKQRVRFNSTDAIIPISQDYYNEMLSIQISTVNDNGESLLTDPVLQCT